MIKTTWRKFKEVKTASKRFNRSFGLPFKDISSKREEIFQLIADLTSEDKNRKEQFCEDGWIIENKNSWKGIQSMSSRRCPRGVAEEMGR